MQRFLQLPGAVGRPGGRGACGADQEAASPVLAPEGGPPPWYQALQPEELRWLQAPEEDTSPGASLEGPCPEPGQSQSQSWSKLGVVTPRLHFGVWDPNILKDVLSSVVSKLIRHKLAWWSNLNSQR